MQAVNVGLSVFSGLSSVLMGGYVLRSSYEEWQELNRDPDGTTWGKAWSAFKGVLGILQMGSGAASIGSTIYESRYQTTSQMLDVLEQKKGSLGDEFAKELEEFCRQNPEIPTEYFSVFDDLRVQALVNKHAGINVEELMKLRRLNFASIENLQQINKVLAVCYGTELMGNLFKEIRDPDPELNLKTRITYTLLQSGGMVYLSLSRVYCANNMDNENRDKSIANITNIMGVLLKSHTEKNRIRREKEERIIENALYVPYKMPTSFDHPSLNYIDIPEYLENVEPFCQNNCPISLLPIAKALFIIQNDFPHILDKRSLIKYALTLRNSGRNLINPFTNLDCRYSDVYECPEWDNNREALIRQHQDLQIQRLQDKLQAKLKKKREET